MQKQLSKWWVRFLLILIPVTFIMYLGSFFPFGFLASTIVLTLLLTIFSLFIQSIRAGSNYSLFGLQFDRFTIIDITKGFLIVISSNLIFIALGLLFGYEFEIHENFESYNFKVLAFYSVFIFIMAFKEELIFRGILFQSLRDRFGDVVSIVLMSVIFSFAHFGNPDISMVAAINIVLAGVVLSIMYITTESLWLPISFHFFWNLNQQVILGSDVSGLSFDIEIFKLTAVNSEMSWLFGGAFGTEEGLLTTIIITLLCFISFKINKKNPFIMATKFKVNYEESKILES